MKFQKLFVALMLMASLSSFAQDQYVFLASEDSTQMNNLRLEEVYVSAEKRSQKLSDIPSSISTLSAVQIERSQMETVRDLTGKIPNLFMPDYGNKLTAPVYIRGIGSRINSPSVGLYVDDVPYFEKAVFDFELFDLQSIEVLRGPQGTLYGRNTMGGLIYVKTKPIGEEQYTKISTEASSYDKYKVRFLHNQPLKGDEMGLSVAGSFLDSKGIFTNSALNEEVDDINSQSGRVKYHWQINPKLKMQYIFNMELTEQGGYPYAQITENGEVSEDIAYDHRSVYERDLFVNSVAFAYDLGNSELKSITSWQNFDDFQDIDQDFTTASLFMVTQDQKQNLFTQEFLLKSKGERKWNWMNGVFAFHQGIDRTVGLQYGVDGIAKYKLPPNYHYEKLYDFTIKGVGLYHQSQIDLGKLSIIAGLRVDYEEDRLDYDYNTMYDASGTEKKTDKADFKHSIDDFVVLPKLALKYQWTPAFNTYASVSKGYKSGGFNTTIEREEDESYEAEHAMTYEAGFKWSFFKNKVSLNTSAFYINWEDQQVYQTVPSGRGSMLKNAGESHSEGIEAELSANPCKNFLFNASYGYTFAQFDEYIKNETSNFSDNVMPYIPRSTFQTNATFRFPIGGTMLDDVNLFVAYQRIGKHYWNVESVDSVTSKKNVNNMWQDPYGLFNTRVSLNKDQFSLSVWMNNVFDQEYQANVSPVSGKKFVQAGKPRILGVTLTATL
ncbi:TonB-dependent receptor [Puteibacter caeruleilacunae]|nr:TonB-dependent receptor [Puteibacter caeruleilacunae]